MASKTQQHTPTTFHHGACNENLPRVHANLDAHPVVCRLQLGRFSLTKCKEAVPLIAVVSMACCAGAIQSVRHLLHTPDVMVDHKSGEISYEKYASAETKALKAQLEK